MTYLPPLNGGRINATIGGNTAGAGALISSGTLTLAGGNNVTLSQNGNAVTISAGNGGAGGGIALANSQTTYTSGTANLIEGGGAITIASTTGQSFKVSVPQISSLSGTGAISISTNGATISIGAPTGASFTAGMSTGGNTSGNTGLANNQLVLAGGNNITLSQATATSGNVITISAASQSVQTQSRFNMTLAGNSTSAGAGYAQVSSGTLTLAGGNNITLSQNGNAVTISAGNGGAGGGIALANSQTTFTSGTANLIEGGGAITIASTTGQSFNVSVPQTSSLSATGIVSISTNGGTISIGAPDNGETISRFVYPSEYMPLNTVGATNNTVSFNYVSIDRDVSGSQFRALFSVSANTHTSASTNTYGLTAEVGVYTRNASTISKMSSGSQTWSGTYSTNSTASVQGIRELTIPMNAALTAGEYWFALRLSSSSSNASVGYSQFVVSNQQTLHLNPGRFGAGTATSQLLYPWHGMYSVTSGALPASATINDVLGTGTRGSAAMYWFDVRNYTVL